MDCAGGLVANLVCNLLLGQAVHAQLQYLPVFLANALLGKGCNLYFEMLKDGQPVNPMDYLAEE